MALCQKETKSDYIWIFSNFIMHFQRPKVVFADRNNAQYKALSKLFTTSKVIFCLWHLQRNVICYLNQFNINWEEFKNNWWNLYYSKNDKDFSKKWRSLLLEYPQLKNCNAFLELEKIKIKLGTIWLS
ncbi:unnamed protein product [Blepharisma stoltei]|uniref:MULE transposase domain-containing protein n=1 Tax=Blepharisma stoltei TaxID=1481888 RepID=A0AAU9K2T9_9CILI|nr:unnamed protein product [Blepharisma stoltei]